MNSEEVGGAEVPGSPSIISPLLELRGGDMPVRRGELGEEEERCEEEVEASFLRNEAVSRIRLSCAALASACNATRARWSICVARSCCCCCSCWKLLIVSE